MCLCMLPLLVSARFLQDAWLKVLPRKQLSNPGEDASPALDANPYLAPFTPQEPPQSCQTIRATPGTSARTDARKRGGRGRGRGSKAVRQMAVKPSETKGRHCMCSLRLCSIAHVFDPVHASTRGMLSHALSNKAVPSTQLEATLVC